jgi:hypothetical protein
MWAAATCCQRATDQGHCFRSQFYRIIHKRERCVSLQPRKTPEKKGKVVPKAAPAAAPQKGIMKFFGEK